MSSLAQRPGDMGLLPHWIGKRGTKILLFTKMMEVETGTYMNKSKTIGTVTAKNNDTILMCAYSGYSSSPDGLSLKCLDTAKWNSLALNHVSRQIQFKFPGNIRDNNGLISEEQRGRAHAGHVEILLACWYVVSLSTRHLGLAGTPEEQVIPKLKMLRDIHLGDKRTAFITIDSEPCRPCLQFLNKLTRYTGVTFNVLGSQGIGPVQVRENGKRRSDEVLDVFLSSDVELVESDSDMEEFIEVAGPSSRPPPRFHRPVSKQPVLQWSPEDPEMLLTTYKKKTPVYAFPGYAAAPRPSITTNRCKPEPEESQEYIIIDSDSDFDSDFTLHSDGRPDVVMADGEDINAFENDLDRVLSKSTSATIRSNEPMSPYRNDDDDDDLDSWVDLGEDVGKDNSGLASGSTSPGSIRSAGSFSAPDKTKGFTGEDFAKSAYEAVKETELGAIEPNSSSNRTNLFAEGSKSNHDLGIYIPRLEEASVFRQRFTILRAPKPELTFK
ncbi:hypothetical protein GGS20DRAFT_567829 [Poronia punctata]|nr:hypothetical protein GGS20DRAFT_567829 [Poronia punctata]